MDWGAAKGWSPRQNTWVIDNLIKDDVVVVDLFGKLRDGTFAGDNLATAIKTRTGTGMVVDGGIRDARQIAELDGLQRVRARDRPVSHRRGHAGRREHPGPDRRRDGAAGRSGAGDVGRRDLHSAIVGRGDRAVHSEETRLRDEFGKGRLAEGVYSSSQIDTQTWEPEIQADYLRWKERRGRP